jgi:cell division protease FtsH
LDVSTGASNDLQQANHLARDFVTKYGLGEHVGLYDNDDGRSFKLSDKTKQRIDTEVENMVGQAYEKALQILVKNKKQMDTLTDMLLHHVTVDETMLGKRVLIQY